MIKSHKCIPVRFYATLSGKEPVREWILSLEDRARKKIGSNILIVQYGWPVRLPLVRPLGNGYWEIRSGASYFYFYDDTIVLLHGFIKKSQKMPIRDFKLAVSRAKNYKSRK